MRANACRLSGLRRHALRWAASLFAALSTLAAHAAPATLRVVTDDNYPPYLFLGRDGKPQGYLVDLWKLWQQKTGVRVDLEPMQWSRAQAAMRDGKADVIDMIFHTPGRDRLYRYSRPYSTQTVGIYVDHSIQGIRGPGSLPGFRIGVERGDACIHALHKLGIDDLALYPDYEAILAAARSGVIKMFCMDDDPANYYLYLAGDQLAFDKAFTLYTGHFHWAVRRGDNALFNLVSQGMRRITPQQREALRRRWFRHPVQFLPYLREAVIAGLVAALLLLAGLVWIGLLRRAVRASTLELHRRNAMLERRAVELLLQHSRLRTLIESSPDAIWLKNAEGVYVECNARAARLAGVSPEAFVGSREEELAGRAPLFAAMQAMDRAVRARGAAERSELTVSGKGSRTRDFEVIRVPIATPDGGSSGELGMARDITRRKRADRETRIAAAAFESQDGIIISDARDTVERVNTAFTELTGYAVPDLLGRTVTEALRSGAHGDAFYRALDETLVREGRWRGSIWCRRKDGSLAFMHVVVTTVRDEHGNVQHFLRSLHDLSAEMRANERAERLAKYDPLTQLPNRGVLEQRLTETAVRAAGDGHRCGALLVIGLDDFAVINSVHGRKAGDGVLQEAARRLRSFVLDGDTLARISADLFALHVVCRGVEPLAVAQRVGELAQAMREALGVPYRGDGASEARCTASIGVTLLTGPIRSADALVNEAEIAMFHAKSAGKNAVRLFEREMQRRLDARTTLANDLRAAIRGDQFQLYYQPQVDSQGRIRAAEALLRWNHPSRGMVSPVEFIPVAEQTGLIEPLGGWAIREACRQLARWSGLPSGATVVLAVNVSARQFRQPDFGALIEQALAEAGSEPARLKLEITESLAMEDIDDAVGKLEGLKRRGVRVSLDDFGTGNSSLSYLTRLPLDQIKIDKSFVGKLPDSSSDALIVQMIIGMARGLGLEVVAEGVETQAQFAYLRELGCDLYQGYLFARPLPREAFEARLGELLTP